MEAGKDSGLSPGRRLAAAGLIVAFSFILYANTIPLEYALDDKAVITLNSFTQQGVRGIPEIFTHDWFAATIGEEAGIVPGGRYRPLSIATFALEYQFFGENPHVSHFVNVVLYALTGLLIFLLLTRLDGSKWHSAVPFVTTLLFLSHPLHTEVVANIKARDEMLAFLGGLYALWLALRYLERRKVIYLLLSGVVFFLGLMSKENTVTFLAVVPCTIWFFTRHSMKRNLLCLLPLLAATAIFALIRVQVLGGVVTAVQPELMNDPFIHASTADRFATVFSTYGIYLKLLFFPHPLTYDYYPFHVPIVGWGSWRAIVGLIATLGLAIVAIAGLRRRSVISFGLIFSFATFAIVSNFFFSIGTMMSERFMYMSSLGFCLIAVYLLVEKLQLYLGKRKAAAIGGVVLVAVLAGFTAKTITRNPVWKDDFTLFTTDVKVSANSALGNYHAGKQYYSRGKSSSDPAERNDYMQLGIEHLTRAVEIHPNYVNALFVLAEAHYEYDQDHSSSLRYLEKYAELVPGKEEVLLRIGSLYAAHTDRTDKAVLYLERTLAVNPLNRTALYNLGAIHFNSGDYERALVRFEALAKYYPGDAVAEGYIARIKEALFGPE
jgi:hypothetical protein